MGAWGEHWDVVGLTPSNWLQLTSFLHSVCRVYSTNSTNWSSQRKAISLFVKRKSICWQFVWHQDPMSLSSFLMKCFSTMKDTKYHPSTSVQRPFWATCIHEENRVILPCRRVWLFDCGGYLNTKEIVLPSTLNLCQWLVPCSILWRY